ncbi:MAG: hypothetical protein AB2L14_01370 [Candidatus Xenobiia bacterium LiM19]
MHKAVELNAGILLLCICTLFILICGQVDARSLSCDPGLELIYQVSGLTLPSPEQITLPGTMGDYGKKHVYDCNFDVPRSITVSGTAGVSDNIRAKLEVVIAYRTADDSLTEEQRKAKRMFTEFSREINGPGSVSFNEHLEIPANAVAVAFQVHLSTVTMHDPYHNITHTTGLYVDAESKQRTGPAPTPPPDPGDWTVVIGPLAAVAAIAAALALAAAAAKAKKKKPDDGKPDREKKKKKQQQYILQLSVGEIRLTPDKPAKLTVTAWKVDSDTGSYARAPEAALAITVNPAVKSLNASPLSGNGQIICDLSLTDMPDASEASLHITSSAGGSSTAADVRLTLETAVEMEFF